MGESAKVDEAKLRKVISASLVGSVVEWYDFYLYGTASALVFNKLFFPSFNPMVGTLLSLSTFAIGFLVRPIAGTFFGNLGDKIGRSRVLMITLILMGLATVLVGLLPTYNTIGFWAPVLLVLLRILQASGAGAEYAGAVLLSAEYAPPEKRGLYSAAPYTGVSIALLISTGVIDIVSMMTKEQFNIWGWRIPFLLGIVGVIVGIIIRRGNMETPIFEEVKEEKKKTKLPIAEVFRLSGKKLMLAWGLCLSDFVLVYLYQTFAVAYVTKQLGLPGSTILNALLLNGALQLITIPGFGALSDRIGRKPVLLGGAALSALFSFPFFWLLNTRSALAIVISVLFANGIARGAIVSAQASWMSELFETRVRYSGFAIGREWPSIMGGISPVIATALLMRAGGSWWPIAGLMCLVSVIAFISVYLGPERARMSFKDIDQSLGELQVSPSRNITG